MSSQVPRPAYADRAREDPAAPPEAGTTSTTASTAATSRRRDPRPVAMRKVCQTKSGRLAGHRPDGDDVGAQQDDRERERRAKQSRPPSRAQATHSDAAHDEGDEEDEPADVGEEEPDVEPPRSGNTLVVPALLRGDPLGTDTHHERARQRHHEQGPVAEAQESRVPSCQAEAGGAGEQPADE